MKRILAALILAAVAIHGLGCVSCTEIGCDSGVDVTVDGFSPAVQGKLPAAIKICLGADCQSYTVSEASGALSCTADTTGSQCSVSDGGTLKAFFYGETQGEIDVSVEVKDSAAAVVFTDSTTVEITESKPNGDQCEPTCHVGAASLTVP